MLPVLQHNKKLYITIRMKYTGNTISKPVVGKEAEALSQAIKTGGFVANSQALETIRKIAERVKS